MFIQKLILIVFAHVITISHATKHINPIVYKRPLAIHQMPLSDRYNVPFVNDVFKDNILLTLAYERGLVKNPSSVDWNKVTKEFSYKFTLSPHENYAFHENVLSEYQGKISQTTHAKFNAEQGFKSDGYLFGDGVCHLASLINWVARDAGLQVTTLTNHDFANIPDVPKKYGVAIYDEDGNYYSSAVQNLYITNNKNKPVTFFFDYKNNVLTVSVI